MYKNQFDADLAQLPNMMGWIKENIQSFTTCDQIIHKIELACEEALVNIISYAYPKSKGQIQLCILQIKAQMHIIIKDQGVFFNPVLLEKTVDPKTPIEEREIGGLGILLMKQIMDEIHYSREDQTNVLTLVKNIPL